jgi:hypothetical protein
MRWMSWGSVAVVFCGLVYAGLVDVAVGGSPYCGCHGNAMTDTPDYQALSGGACCSPPGYTVAPGCCEYTRPCCTNVWAGYCEERARADAFCSRLGTPRGHHRLFWGGEPVSSSCKCVPGETIITEPTSAEPASASPTPAVKSTDAEKSGKRLRFGGPVAK